MAKRRSSTVLSFNRQYATRAPGESTRQINAAQSDEARRRGATRRRIEAIAERRELERETEGDW